MLLLMRVIALSTLKSFWASSTRHRDAEGPTLAWYRDTLQADWAKPTDVKRQFGTASILQGGRVVFNIEAYERAHFPMDLPDAVDAIKFRMEQSGLTVKDLEPVIGRTNRVYEVLSRRRPLSLRMIEGLHRKFGIPAESLLRQSAIVRAKSTA